MSMEDFGDFGQTEPSSTQLDFGGGGDDEFAAAEDPFASAGGMQMNMQSNSGFGSGAPMMAAKHDDYTPEELEIIQRVEEEQQERKK